MFILIEIDRDSSWGIDWFKYSKGFRLGFFAIHVCTVSSTEFFNALAKRKVGGND